MTKYVPFMLLSCLLAGCGEDAAPGGGGNGGVAEGEGEGSAEGEGEGSPPNGGDGEGEGEGTLPPGGDGEPCGPGNTCQDGYECGAEEPDICTCPQWFEGRWWFEVSDLQPIDYEYDLQRGDLDAQFWAAQEIELRQDGCGLIGPRAVIAFASGDGKSGGVLQPPDAFSYKRHIAGTDIDGKDHWIEFNGSISQDHRLVNGRCEGEYVDASTVPDTLFRITCNFTLMRR